MEKIREKLISLDFWQKKLVWYKTIILKPIYQKYIVPRKVRNIREKEVIRVLFVLHELGSWKTENLYLAMRHHPRFDARLLLVSSKEKYSYDIIRKYIEEKEYPYETLKTGESIKKTLHPDIIFYGKPYVGILPWRIFFANNLYALFCNVMYSFRNRNSPHLKKIVYSKFVWQEYVENDKIIEEKRNIQKVDVGNLVNTGLPVMDVLLLDKSHFEDPWMLSSMPKKRIIYAPHHTLDTETVKFRSPFHYATFLDYADFMLEMAEKYKDKVQWAFKPHPLLRSKLYKVWGAEKTDAYYHQWNYMDNGQIEEGEYWGLFKHSDAMIHDCGSFKLEYLYTGNPVMYLMKKNPEYDYENWQTERALELHYKGHSKADVEQFIINVIESKDPMENKRKDFVDEYLTPPNGKSACDNIINAILGKEEYIS